MRPFLAFLLFATALVSTRAAEVGFVRVWPAWRTEESFRRISEYFTGKENTGSQVILRTHADSRAGFYFLTRVTNPGAEFSGAKFVLAVIAPDSAEPKRFEFPAEVPAGDTIFQLGLTKSDWVGPNVHPVAWKLELTASNGHVLAVQKSFLWEKPAQ